RHRRRPRSRLRAVSPPRRAARPARRHAVGRRAADAGDRPRPDGPPATPHARRALARPGAADRPADLRHRARAQCARPDHGVPGRAERLPRAQARAPRLRHGQRPDHADRHRRRAAQAPGGAGGVSRRRPALMGVLFEEDSLGVFLLVTVLLGGGAAWLAGRAIAPAWRPWWGLIPYMLILGVAIRSFHVTLFDGTALSPRYYAVDTAVALIFAGLGFHLTRKAQMRRQYGFLDTTVARQDAAS